MNERKSLIAVERFGRHNFVKTIKMPEKVKTISQIAIEYGIHRSTLYKWLNPIKLKLKLNGRSLRAWQINLIYDFLDKP
jgi:DNA invertase Pin-like site-specific DNA recombinase